MSFDEGLAQRVRELLEDLPGIVEKKMFGGLAFMIDGNMSVGIVKHELMVRVGADDYPAALAEKDAREMDFTGKPLKGFVYVRESSLDSDDRLRYWVERGRNFALSLPPK